MTQVIEAPPAWMGFDRRRISRQFVIQNVLGVVAIGASAVAGAWIMNTRLAKAPDFVEIHVDATSRGVASNPFGALYAPGFASPSPSSSNRLALSLAMAAKLGSAPAPAPDRLVVKPAIRPDEVAPLPPPRPVDLAVLESPPLPVPRPADLRAADSRPADSRPADTHGARAAVAPAAPADGGSFLQKLFGGAPSQPGATLAYASPETTSITRDARSNLLSHAAPEAPRFSLFGPSPTSVLSRYDKYTAVYDLTAHVVYLPNGTRLEAHSGLGDRLDDPRYVSERGRGATPPHLYELTPREQIFHGVQALRLTPVGGDGDIFGRAGLLAHSYMLGPNGDSNGCVSFKDYDAFLQAYQSGQVKHLAVVARLD